jgi:hypothetical protein
LIAPLWYASSSADWSHARRCWGSANGIVRGVRGQIDGEIDIGGQLIDSVQEEREAAHDHETNTRSGEQREQPDEIGRHDLM